MLNNLTYHIMFSSTKKSFSNNLKFKPGLTVISGRNERGKSLIFEMIEYALFGTSALRGIREDYDKLDVELTFEVKGQQYKVVRQDNKATLNGKLAVGTAAVNRKILQILGFNLDVWRIGCSSKQGELDRLTVRMKPTERRRMVDEVIGLSQMEQLEKEYRAEGNGYKRAAQVIEAKTIAPIEPETPANYEPSEVLEVLYDEQLETEAERRQLEKLVEPESPVEPVRPDFQEDVEEHERERIRIEVVRAGLERDLQRIPCLSYARQVIEEAGRYYDQKKRGPRSSYSESELSAWLATWHDLRKAASLAKCPACGTVFDPASSEEHSVPTEPPLSFEQVKEELLKLDRWRDCEDDIILECKLTEEETKEQLQALAHEDYRNELLEGLSKLPVTTNRSDELLAKQEYEQRYNLYVERGRDFEIARRAYHEGVDRLASLPEPDGSLQGRLKESRLFEEQKRRYNADRVVYEEAMLVVEAERAKAEDCFNASDALKDTRSKIKQHLIPSLNKVASHLLSEMTDGERSKIVVDEDFEVMVDNQHVRTLSGSGISVVNLALRIALGQVLTQSVVPVFLADEIDKDMDEERATATRASLRKLTKMLDKVIVISHNNMEGDHSVVL